MVQVAIFAGTTLRRNLTAAARRDVSFAFFAPDARVAAEALRSCNGALVELRSDAAATQLKMDLHDLSEDLPTGWERIPEVARKTFEAYTALTEARKQLAAAGG